MEDSEIKYFVYSREHNAWWRRNHAGYTFDPLKAGQYTMAEAEAIVKNANAFIDHEDGPNEFCYSAPSLGHLNWSH